MSVRVTADVWECSKQSGSKLLVLLAIADNADTETRKAFPGIEYLAKKTRMSKRQVRRLIKELVEADELAVIWGGAYRGDYHKYFVLTGLDDTDKAQIKAMVANDNADKGDVLSPFQNAENEAENGNKGDIFDVMGDIALSHDPLTHIYKDNDDSDQSVLSESAARAQTLRQVLTTLQFTTDRNQYNTHLKDLTIVELTEGAVIFGCKQSSLVWLTSRLAKTVSQAADHVLGRHVEVSFQPQLFTLAGDNGGDPGETD